MSFFDPSITKRKFETGPNRHIFLGKCYFAFKDNIFEIQTQFLNYSNAFLFTQNLLQPFMLHFLSLKKCQDKA